MFDQEFLKYLASLGVGGIIAGLMFAFYRRDVRIYHDQWHGQTVILMQLVRDNTVALTGLKSAVTALHHRLDRMNDRDEN